MRRLATLAWACLLGGWCASAPAQDLLKIGSWNIENLGDRRYGQHPAALADYIHLAGVDLLALQEIWDTDNDEGAITNERLDQVVVLLHKHSGAAWKYVLFPKRDPGELRQHVGLLWNTSRLTPVGEPHALEVEYANEETWKRRPHAMKFSTREGLADFVVVPLHMKSNHAVEGLPEPAELRRLEAAALAARLPKLREHFQDQDIVLLGDMNCKKSDEPALRVYKEAGLLDLNAEDAITFVKGSYREPFDRVFVPTEQAEFKYSRQHVLAPAAAVDHHQRLSDHWMALITMRLLRDDD